MRTFQLLTLSLLLLLQVYSQRPGSNTNTYSCSSLNNCNAASGYGTCSSSQRQCVCNEGYFDTDCSEQVTKLQNGVSQTLTISHQSWGYLYISLDTIPGDAIISFQASEASIMYSLLLEGADDFYLPSDKYTPALTMLIDEYQTSQSITIKSNVLNYADGGWLLIGAWNANSSGSLTLTVTNTWNSNGSSDSASSNKSVFIVPVAVGISAFMIVCLIGGYTCRKRRMMREQIQQLGQNENGNPLPNVQERPQQQNAIVFLKKEELDAYSPIKNFGEIKTSFNQTSCSICLDEYNGQAVCRQLYCEHIFHSGCIEEWLAKHTECPNCKCEISKKAIQEYYKKVKEEKKSSRTQEFVRKINESASKHEYSVIVEIPLENIPNSPTRVESREIPIRSHSSHSRHSAHSGNSAQ